MLKERREHLYALMNEATTELERRTPEQCNDLLGTGTWKAYRSAEKAASDTRDADTLGALLKRMRHLLDQIASK